MSGLEGRLGKEHTVVRDDPDQESVEPGESRHQRRGVALLELVEARPVHQPRDNLAHFIGLPGVGGDDAIDFARVVGRIFGRSDVGRKAFGGIQRRHDRPGQMQRMLVVIRQIVGDTRQPSVDIGAAQFLGGDFFAGRGLYERRAAQEDRAGPAHDDRLVGHRRDVRAARRTGPHDDGDLRNAFGRHPCLIEEDAAEVVAIGEDLGLQRQEGPPESTR